MLQLLLIAHLFIYMTKLKNRTFRKSLKTLEPPEEVFDKQIANF